MSDSRLVIESDTRLLTKGRYKLCSILSKSGLSVRISLLVEVVKRLVSYFPTAIRV